MKTLHKLWYDMQPYRQNLLETIQITLAHLWRSGKKRGKDFKLARQIVMQMRQAKLDKIKEEEELARLNAMIIIESEIPA